MRENVTICNCKQVTLADIVNALHDHTKFEDVLDVFSDVQKVTHCSTGCGGCYEKVLGVISDELMGHPSTPATDCGCTK